eukprot:1652852-Pyramimonas_sp.AAC.1
MGDSAANRRSDPGVGHGSGPVVRIPSGLSVSQSVLQEFPAAHESDAVGGSALHHRQQGVRGVRRACFRHETHTDEAAAQQQLGRSVP